MAYTTINKPSLYFNTVLYTGTGSSNSLTGVGFQPDWVWIKKRNAAVGHRLYDAVRGVQNTLFSNDTAAEATGQSTTLTAFNSDGFTVISESGVNASGDTYVAWNWLGANSTTSNTSGTITSTVSANTTAGFSVVSWTGAGAAGTVGHGLGAVPKFIITKKRNNTGNWACYHVSLGNTQYVYLNTTAASATYSGFWNNTTPTSTLISLGTDDNVTGNGDNIIAYCFAEVKGYSKFGSYTGNGSTDGTFIYTGFKPAWTMVKRSDSSSTSGWIMYDNKRNPYNIVDLYLQANSSNAETGNATDNPFDFVSNGFKLRYSNTATNASGGTYIYAAFAENPFVSSTFIPTTAR